MACPGITDKQLVDAANTVFQGDGNGFQGLANAYGAFDDYWELGHSFDTIVDYFVNVSPNATNATGFAQIALERYQGSQTNACWYDDYGWWGIAALKASQHQELFGSAASAFSKICFDKDNPRCCWTVMDANAPNVWRNNQNDSRFAVLKPRVDGGIWNADWTRPDECGTKGPPPLIPPNCGGNKQGDNLRGIQNTVTNCLYLVLAARLFQSTLNGDYEIAARREYFFLENWWGRDVTDPTHKLLNKVGPSQFVIRERVSTYAFSNGYFPIVCGYQPELAWAGDQGLFLGGLVDRMLIVGRDSPDYAGLLDLAKAIALGVKSQIDAHHDGILTAWVTQTDGGDPGDYDTGVAVYMRYLLYAYQAKDRGGRYLLRDVLRDMGYVDFVCKNTANVIKNYKSHSSVVDLTNDLATLIAAIVMSNSV
jgi:hypothetical protein